MTPDTTTHRRTCPFCEAMCGLVIEHRGSEIVSIKPNRNDILSRGHICPKAVALKDVHEDPDRLRAPVQRVDDAWQPISWAAAFDLIERRIRDVRRQHGHDAVAIYSGNPTVHNLGAILAIGDFIHAVRTRNLYSATSVDQLPHMVASWAMFGHQFLVPVPDIDRTQLFVCIGGNPVASGGSLMSAPGFERRVEALKGRGGRFVVVDPRRTESAAIADQYISIRPGGDVYLLLGVLREIFESHAVAPPAHLAQRLEGMETLRDAVRAFDPAALAQRAGVGRDVIAGLARELVTTPQAVVYGRVGACTQEFGGLTMWLIYCVNLVTAHLDVEGGMMFGQPPVDLTRAYGTAGHRDRFRSRVRGLPEFGNELPVVTLAEEILTPGDGQVRALFTFAGNPVLSTPNGRQLDRALDDLEFMVSIDLYINETTRHADLILPPTSPLERGHYDLALAGLAVRNFAKYAPALFEKAPDALHDHEILGALTQRLDDGSRWTRSVGRALRRWLGPERLLDFMLRTGAYGRRSPQRLTLRRLREAPDGIDLGPLRPSLLQRLVTSDGRVHVAPDLFVQDLARAAADLGKDPAEFVLIGRRHVRSNNSWLHNSRRLVKGKPRCTLLMHPSDAALRGIGAQALVRVTSRVGSIEVAAELSEDMRPGVVSLPHGWGHDRPGVQLAVAQQHAGVSINDLIDDRRIDVLTGTAVLNGTPVAVELVGDAGSQLTNDHIAALA